MGINENILCGLNDLWSEKDPNISILSLTKLGLNYLFQFVLVILFKTPSFRNYCEYDV